MTGWDFLTKMMSGEFAFANMMLVLAGVIIVTLFFRGPILMHLLKKLHVATKEDIEQLRNDTKADMERLDGKIDQLRNDTKADMAKLDAKIEQLGIDLRKNDLFHISKAILLHAQGTIKSSNPELYRHIEDTLLESTPTDMREMLVR